MFYALRTIGSLIGFIAAAGAGWECEKAYRLSAMPALAEAGRSATPFYFAAEKTGSPKTFAKTSISVRLSGFGALARDPDDPTGSTFWTIDDRGLSSVYENGSIEARVFALPDYHQKLVKLRVEGDSLRVLEIDSIATLESAEVFTTGVNSSKVAADETALAGDLDSAVVDPARTVAAQPGAYDFEALRILPSGNFLLADELGPFLVEVDKNSKRIVREWYPGKGLPLVFAKRRGNRGFEAMAVAPSGKIVAMLQSPADNSSSVDTKNSRMIRVLRFDPETGTSSEYAYLADPKGPASRPGSEVKIGDMVALSETRFLAIEHGEDLQGKYWIDLVEFDISGATDLHDPEEHKKGRTWVVGGSTKTPEEIGMDTSNSVWATAGIAPVARKIRLGDLLSAVPSWKSRKPEGLEILGDSALALFNDNDYGAQDKNSDGIWHVLPESERAVSLVYLKLGAGTGVRPGPGGRPGASWRLERTARAIRVISADAGEAPLVLRDTRGNVLARGVSRGGIGEIPLDGVPSGVHLLQRLGAETTVPVQVVR